MTFEMRIIALAIAAAALLGGLWAYGHHQYATGVNDTMTRYERAIATQKAQAKLELALANGRADRIQADWDKSRIQQEKTDVERTEEVAVLHARVLALGRLRDPGASPGRGNSGQAQGSQVASTDGSGQEHRPDADGLLSEYLTGLLLTRFTEAEGINTAYASCRSQLTGLSATVDANPQ